MPNGKVWTGPRCGSRRSATLTVELAIILPLFVMLVFGCLEFGALFGDYAMLSAGVREGARVAGTGGTVAEIEVAAVDGAPTLPPQDLEVSAEYRVRTGAQWTDWLALSDANGQNNAPPGSQMRVTMTHQHHLFMGALFSRLADEPGGTTIQLTISRVSRRE